MDGLLFARGYGGYGGYERYFLFIGFDLFRGQRWRKDSRRHEQNPPPYGGGFLIVIYLGYFICA